MVSAYTAFAMRVFGMEQLFDSILRQYNVIRGIGVVGQLSESVRPLPERKPYVSKKFV